MKKFYLCKLCLIVFGALLAVQGAFAADYKGIAKEVLDKYEDRVKASKRDGQLVIQKGLFVCTNVATSYSEFINGRVQRGIDEVATGTSLEINYAEYERREDKKKGWDDSYVHLFVEGHSISERLYTGTLSSEYQGIYYFNDGEVFRAARVGAFFITLTRVYKEDWSGFLTKHYSLDEGSSFTSSLRCKRQLIKGP